MTLPEQRTTNPARIIDSTETDAQAVQPWRDNPASTIATTMNEMHQIRPRQMPTRSQIQVNNW